MCVVGRIWALTHMVNALGSARCEIVVVICQTMPHPDNDERIRRVDDVLICASWWSLDECRVMDSCMRQMEREKESKRYARNHAKHERISIPYSRSNRLRLNQRVHVPHCQQQQQHSLRSWWGALRLHVCVSCAWVVHVLATCFACISYRYWCMTKWKGWFRPHLFCLFYSLQFVLAAFLCTFVFATQCGIYAIFVCTFCFFIFDFTFWGLRMVKWGNSIV